MFYVNVDLKGSGLFCWWGGASGDVPAGAYSGTWSNGDSFAAFCVKLTKNFRAFGKSATYTEGTFSSTVESNLTYLKNKTTRICLCSP